MLLFVAYSLISLRARCTCALQLWQASKWPASQKIKSWKIEISKKCKQMQARTNGSCHRQRLRMLYMRLTCNRPRSQAYLLAIRCLQQQKKRIRALSAAKCQHRLLHGHCNGNSSMQLCARNFPDYASLQCEIRQKYTRRWSKRYRLAAHSCQQLPLMQHRACNVRQLEIPNKFIHTALVMTLFYCCEQQLARFVVLAIVVVVIVG